MSEKVPSQKIEQIETREYLGVKLPVAENREGAPDIKNFDTYVEDIFSRALEQKIATAWALGEPILIEGGTSLGKTRAVWKMCAELGYEAYYQNLNTHTDPADLMGKYAPNARQRSDDDARYIFAEGSVTKALRIEPGKIKVLILDEYNAAHPGVIIRLHEVLDAYKTGGTVTLTEDANEVIRVDRERVKIIALTNPPGGAFGDREPLDPAQIRRWTYHKLPDELPAETFEAGVLALAGLAGTKTEIKPNRERVTPSRPEALSREVLGDIPGMREIVPQYIAFHEAAKGLLRAKRIGNNQRQKFTFDDREEPRRVFSYIARFYQGNVGETMRDALRYFYEEKVFDMGDKMSISEMIRKVDYKPKDNPERRGLPSAKPEARAPLSPETPIDAKAHRRKYTEKMREVFGLGIHIEGAKELAAEYGRLTNGVDFDRVFNNLHLPIIPYTKDELRRNGTQKLTLRFRDSYTVEDIVDKIFNHTLKSEDFEWVAS